MVENSSAKLSIFEVEAGDYRLLQPIWDLRLGYEKYVESPLFPIVLSVSFYFALITPFMIADLYGKKWRWIQKYKIQTDKEVTWPLVKRAIMLTLWNHMLYILPISVAQWVWTPNEFLPAKAPSLWPFIWQQMAALAIFDFEYWVWHSTHHKFRFLYRHVHGVHHEYSAPNCWVTQYLHPWELISVGIFTTTSPWFFDYHPMTAWSFMQFSIIVSVDAHIGYDLPFMPHNWLPGWGGCIKHDMHHQKPLTNFQPFFNWWDKLAGVECPGQLAGGVKPQGLLDFEKREREQKLKFRAKWEENQRLLAEVTEASPTGKKTRRG